jgi:hypothetical protein
MIVWAVKVVAYVNEHPFETCEVSLQLLFNSFNTIAEIFPEICLFFLHVELFNVL